MKVRSDQTQAARRQLAASRKLRAWPAESALFARCAPGIAALADAIEQGARRNLVAAVDHRDIPSPLSAT